MWLREIQSGEDRQRTFTTLKLAEAFRAQLLVAAREGTPFRTADGLPQSLLSSSWSRAGRALRRHIDTFQLGSDGRLFVARTGKAGVPISPPYDNPVSMGTVYRAWHKARRAAVDERQVESLLARRPYDLRHACVSTWLNAGVPPAQVAEWAGHSVELLRVYAKCLDGDHEIILRRIEQATDEP